MQMVVISYASPPSAGEDATGCDPPLAAGFLTVSAAAARPGFR